MGVTTGNACATEASLGIADVSAGALGVAEGVAITAGPQAITARANNKTSSRVFMGNPPEG